MFLGSDHLSSLLFLSTYQMSKSFLSLLFASIGLSETKNRRFPFADKKGSKYIYESQKGNSSGSSHSLFSFLILAICEISEKGLCIVKKASVPSLEMHKSRTL